MKIKSIKPIGKCKVFDLSVKDAEHYILENGVITHNTGSYYSADNIYIIGRQQSKEGTELVGYDYIINVEKSRYVKEKSKIPVSISFDDGLSQWSGLLELALESKHVVKPSNGWYSKVDSKTGEVEDKKYRIKETNTSEFWLPILADRTFSDYVEQRYSLGMGQMLSDDHISKVFESEEE